MIDRKTCFGCLACMDICPQDLIRKHPDNLYVSKYVACGICAKACPQDVLAVEDI